MMYLTGLVVREEANMFLIFRKKKRQELDEARAKEVEEIKSIALGQIEKATKEVEKVNKTAANIDINDFAERLYFATRRKK